MAREIARTAVDEARQACEDVWWTYLPPYGVDVGWYRDLRRTDRVGVVASAQALDVLPRPWPPLQAAHEAAVVDTILRRESNGMYPFLSTLDNIEVVDATAWVVLALSRVAPGVPAREQALRRACAALEAAQLAGGGWGLIAGSELRAYSTALAVRALLVVDGVSAAVASGAARLLHVQHPDSGAWSDAEGRLSVGATAAAVRTLTALSAADGIARPSVPQAVDWLVDHGLAGGSRAAATSLRSGREMVEIVEAGRPRRVPHLHASPSVALAAVTAARPSLRAAVHVRSVGHLVDAVASGDWPALQADAEAVPESWLLHDTHDALHQLALVIPPGGSVWVWRRRVVHHPPGEQGLKKAFRRYRRIGAWVAVGLVISALIIGSGATGPIGWAAIGWFLGSVALGVLGNVVHGVIDDRLHASGS